MVIIVSYVLLLTKIVIFHVVLCFCTLNFVLSDLLQGMLFLVVFNDNGSGRGGCFQ